MCQGKVTITFGTFVISILQSFNAVGNAATTTTPSVIKAEKLFDSFNSPTADVLLMNVYDSNLFTFYKRVSKLKV